MASCRVRVPDPVLLFFFFALMSETTWVTSFLNDYFYREYEVQTNNRTQTCGNNSGEEFETERKAQSVASKWLLYIVMSIYIPSVVVTLVIGSWSDRLKHGRRLMMIIPAIGGACSMIVLLVIVYWKLPIGYIFFGTIAYGLSGGSTLVYLAVYSYTSDVSSIKTRTRRLGILTGMMALGAGMGRTAGGVLLQYIGSYSVLFANLFSYVFCLLYVFFLLDDPPRIEDSGYVNNEERRSLHDDYVDNDVTPTDDGNGCSMKSAIGGFQILKSGELHIKPLWCLYLLLLADGLSVLVSDGSPTIMYLYFLGTPLCWSTSIIGYFFGLSYFCMILGATIVLTVFTTFFHMRDTTIVLLGILSFIAEFVYLAFVTSTWSMFLGIFD